MKIKKSDKKILNGILAKHTVKELQQILLIYNKTTAKIKELNDENINIWGIIKKLELLETVKMLMPKPKPIKKGGTTVIKTTSPHPYKIKESCEKDLILAREVFGSKLTTRKQYESMMGSLCKMLLYCPEEIKAIVTGTIDEAEKRLIYFEFNIWDTNGKTNNF